MYTLQRISLNLFPFIVILLAWEFLGGGGLFPPPTKTFETFFKLIVDTIFLQDILVSFLRLSVGFCIGVSSGVFLGVLIGYFKLFHSFFFPLVAFAVTIPKIALLPLVVVLFGLGEESKIVIISLGTFFPAIMTAYGSVKRVPLPLIEASKNLGCSNLAVLSRVIIPYALPNIINSGFRLSLSLGLVLLVAAEMIAAEKGLGGFIYYTGNELQFDKMFSGLVVLGVLGISLNKLVDLTLNVFCKWSVESEGEGNE